MSDIKKEYDAFGPWLLKIEKEDDVPQQFEHLKDQILDGIFAFKIPRAISRREATRGMRLYDSVVIFTDTKVKVFKYQEEAIIIRELEIKNIVCVKKVLNLLLGELIIVTSAEKLVIEFNPVGGNIIEEAISILRKKYVSDIMRVDLDSINETDTIESFLFQTLLYREMIKERVKLVGYQSFMELEKGNAINIGKYKEVYHEPVLQDSLFITNGKELMILTRVKEIKEQNEADYGYKHAYIPLEFIKSVTLEQNLELEHLGILKFKVVDTEIEIKVGADFGVDTLKELLEI